MQPAFPETHLRARMGRAVDQKIGATLLRKRMEGLEILGVGDRISEVTVAAFGQVGERGFFPGPKQSHLVLPCL